MSETTDSKIDPTLAPEGETSTQTAAPTDQAAAPDALLEWKNKVAYLAAEIDNMRKRFTREKGELMKFANEELIRSLLSVADNLHLAVKATKEAETKIEGALKEHPVLGGLVKGVDMTLSHFEQTLERAGAKAIDALGQNFNPEIHEAVSQSNSPDKGDNQITNVLQRGYTLHGRVIRPARVIVNKITN